MKMDGDERRLAKRLSVAGAVVAISPGAAILVSGGPEAQREVSVSEAAVRSLLARGALEVAGEAGLYRLSPAGRLMVRRMLSEGGMATQHQDRAASVITVGGERRAVTVNRSESPLAWLRSRRGRDGQPLIDAAAFEAGERLRSDFTRGQMMPSVTASWNPAASATRGSGHAGGIAELTDAALAARLRVGRAVDSLGPELAGAVVDFCCFLKGIDQIESERGWPQRSAKLVIRLGLSALARHYGLASESVGLERRRAG